MTAANEPIRDIRAKAEAVLAKKGADQGGAETPSVADSLRLLHELQVHQIELELQNDELRRTQIDLEEARDRYADLYDFAPVGYFTLFETGTILEVNLTGAALLNRERSMLLGTSLAVFIARPGASNFRRHLHHALKNGCRESCEIPMTRAGGGRFFARLDSKADSGVGSAPRRVRTVITDITDRKAATDALKAAREAAELATAAKSHFLTTVSHDLRGPLYAITLYNEMLGHQTDDPQQLGLIEKARVAADSLNGMIDTLLDIGCLSEGILQPQISRFPLQPLLDRLVTEFQPLARQVGIEIRCRPCRETAISDIRLLERIVRNLLSNALRYTKRGRILLCCRRTGDSSRIQVWDTGLGIPEENLKAIFEDFYQIDSFTRDFGKGLGLGLSICRSLCSLLGHRLDVKSKHGRGSVFSVFVPVSLL